MFTAYIVVCRLLFWIYTSAFIVPCRGILALAVVLVVLRAVGMVLEGFAFWGLFGHFVYLLFHNSFSMDIGFML